MTNVDNYCNLFVAGYVYLIRFVITNTKNMAIYKISLDENIIEASFNCPHRAVHAMEKMNVPKHSTLYVDGYSEGDIEPLATLAIREHGQKNATIIE